MDKRVILAVAGAGKTYHICHTIDPNKRNLILAYTNENIYNIQRELCSAHNSIPELTTVMTFDSFVYHNMILPYEPSIAEYFGQSQFVSQGICTIDPPPQRIKNNRGQMVANPKYIPKDQLEHYITKNRQYYCATLSELVMQIKKDRESLVKRIAARLNMFYDAVLIDEFQDFREYDYDLIITLSKQLKNVILVGDYHQHSVSATNNSGKPFKKRSNDVSYADFVAELTQAGFSIDETTLEKSRRCSAEVCDFVTQKLGIHIVSYDEHEGSVIWADDIATEILENDGIIKLVFQEASIYSFPAMNWSYSKGDTVDVACVILTDRFDSLGSDKFSVKGVPVSTLNKLYVAMTRSSGTLYLIRASTFKKLKSLYLR